MSESNEKVVSNDVASVTHQDTPVASDEQNQSQDSPSEDHLKQAHDENQAINLTASSSQLNEANVDEHAKGEIIGQTFSLVDMPDGSGFETSETESKPTVNNIEIAPNDSTFLEFVSQDGPTADEVFDGLPTLQQAYKTLISPVDTTNNEYDEGIEVVTDDVPHKINFEQKEPEVGNDKIDGASNSESVVDDLGYDNAKDEKAQEDEKAQVLVEGIADDAAPAPLDSLTDFERKEEDPAIAATEETNVFAQTESGQKGYDAAQPFSVLNENVVLPSEPPDFRMETFDEILTRNSKDIDSETIESTNGHNDLVLPHSSGPNEPNWHIAELKNEPLSIHDIVDFNNSISGAINLNVEAGTDEVIENSEKNDENNAETQLLGETNDSEFDVNQSESDVNLNNSKVTNPIVKETSNEQLEAQNDEKRETLEVGVQSEKSIDANELLLTQSSANDDFDQTTTGVDNSTIEKSDKLVEARNAEEWSESKAKAHMPVKHNEETSANEPELYSDHNTSMVEATTPAVESKLDDQFEAQNTDSYNDEAETHKDINRDEFYLHHQNETISPTAEANSDELREIQKSIECEIKSNSQEDTNQHKIFLNQPELDFDSNSTTVEATSPTTETKADELLEVQNTKREEDCKDKKVLQDDTNDNSVYSNQPELDIDFGELTVEAINPTVETKTDELLEAQIIREAANHDIKGQSQDSLGQIEFNVDSNDSTPVIPTPTNETNDDELHKTQMTNRKPDFQNEEQSQSKNEGYLDQPVVNCLTTEAITPNGLLEARNYEEAAFKAEAQTQENVKDIDFYAKTPKITADFNTLTTETTSPNVKVKTEELKENTEESSQIDAHLKDNIEHDGSCSRGMNNDTPTLGITYPTKDNSLEAQVGEDEDEFKVKAQSPNDIEEIELSAGRAELEGIGVAECKQILSPDGVNTFETVGEAQANETDFHDNENSLCDNNGDNGDELEFNEFRLTTSEPSLKELHSETDSNEGNAQVGLTSTVMVEEKPKTDIPSVMKTNAKVDDVSATLREAEPAVENETNNDGEINLCDSEAIRFEATSGTSVDTDDEAMKGVKNNDDLAIRNDEPPQKLRAESASGSGAEEDEIVSQPEHSLKSKEIDEDTGEEVVDNESNNVSKNDNNIREISVIDETSPSKYNLAQEEGDTHLFLDKDELPDNQWRQLMGDDLMMKIVSASGRNEVKPKDAVVVDFVGRLAQTKEEDSGPVFQEEEGWLIEVAEKDVIPALEMGIRFMRVGEQAVIWSHSKYAYGPNQRKHGQYILPSHSNVRFNVEVKEIVSGDGKDEAAFQLQCGKAKKLIGNDVYANEWNDGGGRQKAIALYKRGAQMLEFVTNTTDDEKIREEAKDVMLDCLNNIVAINLQAKEYHQAKQDAVKVLTYDPNNYKALLRAAKASLLDTASSFEEVEAALDAAAEVCDSNDTELEKLRAQFKTNKLHYKRKSKSMYSKMGMSMSSNAQSVSQDNTQENVPFDRNTQIDNVNNAKLSQELFGNNSSELLVGENGVANYVEPDVGQNKRYSAKAVGVSASTIDDDPEKSQLFPQSSTSKEPVTTVEAAYTPAVIEAMAATQETKGKPETLAFVQKATTKDVNNQNRVILPETLNTEDLVIDSKIDADLSPTPAKAYYDHHANIVKDKTASKHIFQNYFVRFGINLLLMGLIFFIYTYLMKTSDAQPFVVQAAFVDDTAPLLEYEIHKFTFDVLRDFGIE